VQTLGCAGIVAGGRRPEAEKRGDNLNKGSQQANSNKANFNVVETMETENEELLKSCIRTSWTCVCKNVLGAK
jgi:hypothetical protein